MRKLIVLLLIYSVTQNSLAQTGIGTTTPVNKFQVETAAAAPLATGTGFNGNFRLSATGANQIIDFGLGTTYGWIQARDKTSYGTNYILALNPNGGNVGINKVAPTKALDVTGDIGVSGNLVGNNSATSTLAGFAANMNAQTGTTYTLVSTDNGKIVTLNNASAITLTVPSTLFAGFNCMIVQLGAGQITISGSGTTITNRSGFTKSGGANAIVTLLAISSTSFISSGDMSN